MADLMAAVGLRVPAVMARAQARRSWIERTRGRALVLVVSARKETTSCTQHRGAEGAVLFDISVRSLLSALRLEFAFAKVELGKSGRGLW